MTTTSTIDPKSAVENGVKFFDEVMPDWYNLVDLDTLDLAEGCCCMVGQLEDKKTIANEHLIALIHRLPFNELEDTYPFVYGFSIPADDVSYDAYEEGYRLLTEEWKKVILEKRANNGASVRETRQ